MNYKRSPCLFSWQISQEANHLHLYLFIYHLQKRVRYKTNPLKDLKRSSIQNQQYDKISEIKNEIQNINRSQKKKKEKKIVSPCP